MYEWLEREIIEIKTRSFHVTEGEKDGDLFHLQVESYSSLSASYLAFISKFGAAKLYRESNYYQVGVLNPPKKVILKNGEELLCIGHFEDSQAYFKCSLLSSDSESPVFEQNNYDSLEKIADSFEDWLTKRCTDARDSYTEREWEEILKGPKPFTAEEKAIVEARKQFKWRVVGFTENGNIKIAVKNDSNVVLPYLTIGVRAKDNTMEGKIWLDVSGVKPGEESVIEHPCYKKQIAQDNIEVYQLPDPTPEERGNFWEFRK